VPPGHVWLIIGSYGFSLEIDTTVAFGQAAVKGPERAVVSLCARLGDNLHVAAQFRGVGVRLGELAIEPDGVVSGQLGEYSSDLFINLGSESAGVLRATHDSLIDTAGEVAIRIAVTFVNNTLESAALPTHVEVTVVHRTSSVAVREDEWLAGVLGLVKPVREVSGGIVHFVEDTGKVYREVGRAVTTVGSSGTIGDMRFVVGRVGILSVPAALEVELSTNTAGADLLRKEVTLGGDTVEVQAEERNGLLFGASRRWRLGGVSRDHAEVIREDSGLSRLIGEQVVGNGTTVYELEGAVRVLKVQLREPVRRLVFCDAGGGTFRFTKVIRRRDLDSEIRTTDDSVNVTSNTAGNYDGVSTFNDKNVLANEEVSPCGRREGKQ